MITSFDNITSPPLVNFINYLRSLPEPLRYAARAKVAQGWRLMNHTQHGFSYGSWTHRVIPLEIMLTYVNNPATLGVDETELTVEGRIPDEVGERLVEGLPYDTPRLKELKNGELFLSLFDGKNPKTSRIGSVLYAWAEGRVSDKPQREKIRKW